MYVLNIKTSLIKEYDSSVEELYISYPIALRYKPYIGIDIGWHALLEQFCFELEKACQREQENENLPYISSMKEKYGELDISVYGSLQDQNYLDDLTEKYRTISSSVCEMCGKEGKLTSRGWIKTLCKEHNYGGY